MGSVRENQLKLEEEKNFPGLARKIQKLVNRMTDLPDVQDYKDLIQKWDTDNKLKKQQIDVLAQK